MATCGVLPVFLVGGLAVQVRAELGFGVAALGLAATLFFTASALASALLGRVVQRVGSRRGMRAGALLGAVSLLGIGLLAHSWVTLVAFLVVGGVANATANPAANLLLTGVVTPARQGLAFGIKQAAIPTATLLAGLAAPLVALTVGWRPAFLGAAALACLIALVAPREAEAGTGDFEPVRPGSDRSSRAVLLTLTLGLALGSAAAVPLGSFLVESAVEAGVAAGAAGLLLAAGSATGVSVRFFVGWLADRREDGILRMVAGLLAGGVVGYVTLALADGALPLVLGTLLAFGAGWGWPGLFNFALVNENRDAPAAATGFVQTGAYVGSALGPLAFGVVVEQLSYRAAWTGSAGLALAGAAAMMAARRLILRERERTAAR